MKGCTEIPQSVTTADRAPPGATTVTARAQNPIDDPSLEIVVADASDLVRRAMLRLLRDRYVVRTASDGVQALAYLERNPYCTLLTALKMAPMDGVELIRHVLGRWPGRARKIAVMTGWPDPHRWVPPEIVVLNKPVPPEVILSVLESRVGEPSISPYRRNQPREQ